MMKMKLAVTAVLLLTLIFSVAVAEADDAWAPVDRQLYPAPEGGYVGDTMPYVTADGSLELYYLYDTDHNGQGYHPIYRFTTDDLVGYADDGLMLDFGLMSDPDPALGTGSVLRDREGLYHLFYTNLKLKINHPAASFPPWQRCRPLTCLQQACGPPPCHDEKSTRRMSNF